MTQHPKILGLGLYAIFPLLALLNDLVGYATGQPLPVAAFAGVYPISLVMLSVYPPFIFNRAIANRSHDIIEFAKGAYIAAGGIFILVLLSSITTAFVYSQTSIALGLLFVGAGSIFPPVASAAAGYGKMLSDSEKGSTDFLEQMRQHRLFEAIATTYLGLYLREYRLLRRDKMATLVLILSLALCPLGWVILGIAGGYPLILFGILMLPIYLIIVTIELRAWVPLEKRHQVSELIASSTAKL